MRNFATVVYPESAPENWLERLDGLHVPAFVSPLHNQDINPDGSPKKPHWHILIMFAGVKTREQAQEVIDAIGGVGCESVSTVRGYARYLVHADNPEKAQEQEDKNRSLQAAESEIRGKMEREQTTARQLAEMNQKARQTLREMQKQLEVLKPYLSKAEQRQLEEQQNQLEQEWDEPEWG